MAYFGEINEICKDIAVLCQQDQYITTKPVKQSAVIKRTHPCPLNLVSFDHTLCEYFEVLVMTCILQWLSNETHLMRTL